MIMRLTQWAFSIKRAERRGGARAEKKEEEEVEEEEKEDAKKKRRAYPNIAIIMVMRLILL